MPNKRARGPTHPTSHICSPWPRSRSNMARPRKRRSPLCCTMRSRIRAGRRRSMRFGAAMASGWPGSSTRAPIPINRRNRPGANGKRHTSSGSGPSRTRCGWWLRLTSSTTLRAFAQQLPRPGGRPVGAFQGRPRGHALVLPRRRRRARSPPRSPRKISCGLITAEIVRTLAGLQQAIAEQDLEALLADRS